MHVLPLNAVIGGVWLLFWAYWFKAALFKRYITTKLPVASRVRLVAALFISPFVSFGFTHEPDHGAFLRSAGIVFIAAGLAFAVWARVHMGKNWGPAGSKANSHGLITDGPYGVIRHPMYSGMLTAMVGTALATSWVWMLLVGALAWFMHGKSLAEESELCKKFPKVYPGYRRSTYMLLPIAW